jgi:hypothetical protein
MDCRAGGERERMEGPVDKCRKLIFSAVDTWLLDLQLLQWC